jgi:hypothetical protein
LKSLVEGGLVPRKHLQIISAQIKLPRPAAYGNCNFALLRELMPALLGTSVGSGSDTQRAQNSMNLYTEYMNQHVFAPLGIPARYCKPPLTSQQILSYPFTPRTIHGENFGDETMEVNGEGTCGPSGWSLTANDIFQVINEITNGNLLLTNNQKQQMTSGYLGWDNAVRGDCPAPNLCKNGNLRDLSNGIWFWTYAGIFESQIPVVVFVNSSLPRYYQPNDTRNNNPYTFACTAKGQPGPCCTGYQTGNNCLQCPNNQQCGGDIIQVVAEAYAAS